LRCDAVFCKNCDLDARRGIGWTLREATDISEALRASTLNFMVRAFNEDSLAEKEQRVLMV
jgi:hypothetical protein